MEISTQKENDESKSLLKSNFSFKRASTFRKLLSNIRSGEMSGYVHFDIRVPDNLKEKLEAFPPFPKNTLVSSSHNGDFVKTKAEDHKLLTQPQKMLLSSFQLINRTIIIPVL